jgi:predicted dehydrogenase
MNSRNPLNRRGFLGRVLAAGVAPLIVPSRVLRAQTAPSNTVRLGHIGTGGQGTSLLRNFLTVPGAASVAIADPYRERRERAGRFVQEAQGAAPRLYNDFRELLADPGIDAVVIATPDHWHVPVGLAAVRAGKGVYIEKPLGYSLEQNRLMLEAVRKHGVVFQYGTQQRSQELIRRGIEVVLNGGIGRVERVEIWAPGGESGGSKEEIPVPEGLDYDLYLGPAPFQPCSRDRISSRGSYFCTDYSIGFIGGWGAHPLDVAVWGLPHLAMETLRVRGTGKFPPPTDLFNACTDWDVDIVVGAGPAIRFMSEDIARPIVETYRRKSQKAQDGSPRIPGDGTTFFGSRGWMSLSRGACEASEPELLRPGAGEGSRRVVYRKNYYQAFVESVRDRAPLIAPVEDAVASDTLSHLSLMAIESGGEAVWDPVAYRFLRPTALNDRIARPARGNWLV